MGQLDGKVALVTGTSTATTQAIARKLAGEGARLVLADSADAAPELADELRSVGRFVTLPLADEAAWTDAIAGIEADEGHLDVLVTNAAMLYQNLLDDTPAELAQEILVNNYLGTFLPVKHGARLMRKSGGGSIVVMSSITTLLPGLMSGAYGSSKWAIRGLAKTAALENGKYGIRVNLIAGPNLDFGNTWTPEHPYGNRAPEYASQTKVYTPLGTSRGRSREQLLENIAAAALFLASDASSYSTGLDLILDGGATLARYYSPIPGIFEIE